MEAAVSVFALAAPKTHESAAFLLEQETEAKEAEANFRFDKSDQETQESAAFRYEREAEAKK